VASSANLPPTGNTAGDGYLTNDTGALWTWSGSAWTNVGVIRGPQGLTGPAGPQGSTGPAGPAGPIGLLNDPFVSQLTFTGNAITGYPAATDRNYAQFRNGMVVVVLDIIAKASNGVIATIDTSIPTPLPGQGCFSQADTCIFFINAGSRDLYVNNATVNQRYLITLTYMANGQGMGNAGVSPVFLEVSQSVTQVAIPASAFTVVTWNSATVSNNVGGGTWNNQYYTIPKDGYYSMNLVTRQDAATARSTMIGIDSAPQDSGLSVWSSIGGVGAVARSSFNYVRNAYLYTGAKVGVVVYSEAATMNMTLGTLNITRMPWW
jgi:hypothetical protein